VSGRRALGRALVWCALLASPGVPVRADDAGLPRILHVAVPARLAVGRPADLRVTYRAPRANVVALVQVLEDLDGRQRATRQRELDVISRAFGQETGELVVPLAFGTPGRKRIVLSLVTDEREESDPETVEVEVAP
jgi:hypothetical protein